MKNFTHIVLGFLILFPLLLHGQDNEQCATMYTDGLRRAKYPQLGSLDDFETWLQRQKQESNLTTRALETIPVVVHIIYDGEERGVGANILESQVQSQIDVLNEDFQRIIGTPGFNSDSVGANVELEFCLANLDTIDNVLQEQGINRIDRNEMGWLAPPYTTDYVDDVIKPATIWDPFSYLNIWVLPLGNSILGFAQFPVQSGLPGLFETGTEVTDGVVVHTFAFGRIGNVVPPYDQGRAATHEVGHFLGLRHIWGDGGCAADDFCEDTPSSDGPTSGCPVDPVSCDSPDMFQNYMDYTDDDCMNIFTLCQKDRMRTVLENSPYRKELLQSTKCGVPQSAPIANFAIEDTFSCNGQFRFLDRSQEFPSNWFWVFSNGAVDSVKNPVVQFDQPGIYEVTLIANNFLGTGQPLTQSFTVDFDLMEVEIEGETNLCLGDSLSLTPAYSGPNATFNWDPILGIENPSTLNNVFYPSQSTDYRLIIESERGCVITEEVPIKVSPKPTTFILPLVNDTISIGDTVQLQALGADTYEWFPPEDVNDSSLSNPLVYPSQTTTYYVLGKNDQGCEKLDSIEIVVLGFPTVINGQNLVEGVKVHTPRPNPATDQITFEAHTIKRYKTSLYLLDLQGKEMVTVFEGKTLSNTFSYTWQRDLQVPSGLYFAKWVIGSSLVIQKLRLF